MRFPFRRLLTLAVLLPAVMAWAGGSGLNVIVVVNQNSTNSLQLGNDYCQKRGVPPQNVFRMTGWNGGAINWYRSDFESLLRQPLLAMIASRGLTNQAQVVLLSMDIPYRVQDAGGANQNSTTSALFYGMKLDGTTPVPGYPGCSLPSASANSYAFSELPFASSPPDTADTNSFLAMMLTDTSLAGAEAILNSGAASDSTFPTQTVCLAKTSDGARNVRFVEFDDAIFDNRIHGNNSLLWLNTDSTSFTNLLGLLTGLVNCSFSPTTFVPGAMGDTLTSYAGALFEQGTTFQTPLLVFLEAGAAASYGTVVEPCNYTQKFPHPLDYFYQQRGFSLAEAYYQSVRNPYQGLLVGEPLAAPFAQPGAANWSTLTNGSTLRGQAGLSLSFASSLTNLPLGQVDLFIDGTFAQTVTNLPPASGNRLSVTLNGFGVNYTVPVNATVASVAVGLADALNAQTNSTRVEAFATGDRLELESLDIANPGSNVTLLSSNAPGMAAALMTWLTPARPSFLDTLATGYLSVLISNTPAPGDWLQLDISKTNGLQVALSVTNPPGNTSVAVLAQSLMTQVNATAALQPPDGVVAGDLVDAGREAGFFLYARSPGWLAAEIQAALTASTNLLALPPGTNKLEDNLTDLRPRNHLYVSSGVAGLPVSCVLDTTRIPDGFHELAAVAYEGTSVRTQTRISRNVQVQNTSLTASLTPLLAGTNATLDLPLQFTVTANAPSIASIQLFSTGGLVATVSNQQTAHFLIPSTTLWLGLHPFYALVTDTAGHQYRTQTQWLRLIPSMTLSLSGQPPLLSWPSVAGLGYDVLATTDLSAPFQAVATVSASSSTAQWPVTAPGGRAAFYRVRLRP